MKKELAKDLKKFEFTVYLNENIVVQRFFNVIGFNQNAIKSMNFTNVADTNVDVIKQNLKNKTLNFLIDNYHNYEENPSFDQNDSMDMIKVVVKMDDKIISYREWDARIYPSKVRYTIDIRSHIYDMITRIQKCLSEKNDRLVTKYLNHELNSN